MKTNKSYTKRIRVTKKGKLVARKPGQDHFNAKEGGNAKRSKRGPLPLTVSKDIKRRFLSTPSK